MLRERPVGELLDGWATPPRPGRETLEGTHVVLRPVDAELDAEALFAESHPPSGDVSIWTYLPYGPYRRPDELRAALKPRETSTDPLYLTIVARDGARPSGIAAYQRIKPEHGVIEIAHLWFGPSLRRTTAATEAIYLLARHAFDDLGYRRLEWKCDSLNAASRRAALRLGFTFEGVFRRHMVVKGRNRDTAWFAILDDDWPAIQAGFRSWLSPANFDAAGRQQNGLREAIARARQT
jgi:RimJ/RimL family protein N-acetyltransferase